MRTKVRKAKAMHRRKRPDRAIYTKLKGREGVKESDISVLGSPNAYKSARAFSHIPYSAQNAQVLASAPVTAKITEVFTNCDVAMGRSLDQWHPAKVFRERRIRAVSTEIQEAIDRLYTLAHSHEKGEALYDKIRKEQLRFERYISRQFADTPKLKDELLKAFSQATQEVLALRKSINPRLQTPYKNYFEAHWAKNLVEALAPASAVIAQARVAAQKAIDALPISPTAFFSPHNFGPTATINNRPVPTDSAALRGAMRTLEDQLAQIQRDPAKSPQQKQAEAIDAIRGAFAVTNPLGVFTTAVNNALAVHQAVDPDVKAFFEDVTQYQNGLVRFYGAEMLLGDHPFLNPLPPTPLAAGAVPRPAAPVAFSLAEWDSASDLFNNIYGHINTAPLNASEVIAAVNAAAADAAFKKVFSASETPTVLKDYWVQSRLYAMELAVSAAQREYRAGGLTANAAIFNIQQAVKAAQDDPVVKACLAQTGLRPGSPEAQFQQAVKARLAAAETLLDTLDKNAPALTFTPHSPEVDRLAQQLNLAAFKHEAEKLADDFKKRLDALIKALNAGEIGPKGFESASEDLVRAHEKAAEDLHEGMADTIAALPATTDAAAIAARKQIMDACASVKQALLEQAKAYQTEVSPKIKDIKEKQADFKLKYTLFRLQHQDRFPSDRPLTAEEQEKIDKEVEEMDFVKAMDEWTDINLGDGVSLHMAKEPDQEEDAKTGRKAKKGHFKPGEYRFEVAEKDLSPESIAKVGDMLALIAARVARGHATSPPVLTLNTVQNWASLKKMMLAAASHEPPIKLNIPAPYNAGPRFQALNAEVDAYKASRKREAEFDRYIEALRDVALGRGYIGPNHEIFVPYQKDPVVLPDATPYMPYGGNKLRTPPVRVLAAAAAVMGALHPQSGEDPLLTQLAEAQRFLQQNGEEALASTAGLTVAADIRKLEAIQPPPAGARTIQQESQLRALKLREIIDKRLTALTDFEIFRLPVKTHESVHTVAALLRAKMDALQRLVAASEALDPADRANYTARIQKIYSKLKQETKRYLVLAREAGVMDPESFLFSEEYGKGGEARLTTRDEGGNSLSKAAQILKRVGLRTLPILGVGIIFLLFAGLAALGGKIVDAIRGFGRSAPGAPKKGGHRVGKEGDAYWTDAEHLAMAQETLKLQSSILQRLAPTQPLPVLPAGAAVATHPRDIEALRVALWQRLHGDTPLPVPPPPPGDALDHVNALRTEWQGQIFDSISRLQRLPSGVLAEAIADGRLPEMVSILLPAKRDHALTDVELLERAAVLGNNWGAPPPAAPPAAGTILGVMAAYKTTLQILVGPPNPVAGAVPTSSFRDQRQATEAAIKDLRRQIVAIEANEVGGKLSTADQGTLNDLYAKLDEAQRRLDAINQAVGRLLATPLSVQPGPPTAPQKTLGDYLTLWQLERLSDIQPAAFNQVQETCSAAVDSLAAVNLAQQNNPGPITDALFEQIQNHVRKAYFRLAAGAPIPEASEKRFNQLVIRAYENALQGLLRTPPVFPKQFDAACRQATGLPFGATAATKVAMHQQLCKDLLHEALKTAGLNFGVNPNAQALRNAATTAPDFAKKFAEVQRKLAQRVAVPNTASLPLREAYASFLREQLQAAFLTGVGLTAYTDPHITEALRTALNEVVAANWAAGWRGGPPVLAACPKSPPDSDQAMMQHVILDDAPAADFKALQERFITNLQLRKENDITRAMFTTFATSPAKELDAIDEALAAVVFGKLPKAFVRACEAVTGFNPTDHAHVVGGKQGFKTTVLADGTATGLTQQLLLASIQRHLAKLPPLGPLPAGATPTQIRDALGAYQKEMAAQLKACQKAVNKNPGLSQQVLDAFTLHAQQQLEAAFLMPGTSNLINFTDGHLSEALRETLNDLVAARGVALVSPPASAQQMMQQVIDNNDPVASLQAFDERFITHLQLQKQAVITTRVFNSIAGLTPVEQLDAIKEMLKSVVAGKLPKAFVTACQSETGFDPTGYVFRGPPTINPAGFQTIAIQNLTQQLITRFFQRYLPTLPTLQASIAASNIAAPGNVADGLRLYIKAMEGELAACLKLVNHDRGLTAQIQTIFADQIRQQIQSKFLDPATLPPHPGPAKFSAYIDEETRLVFEEALRGSLLARGIASPVRLDLAAAIRGVIDNADPVNSAYAFQDQFVAGLQLQQQDSILQAVFESLAAQTPATRALALDDMFSAITKGELPISFIRECEIQTGLKPTPAFKAAALRIVGPEVLYQAMAAKMAPLQQRLAAARTVQEHAAALKDYLQAARTLRDFYQEQLRGTPLAALLDQYLAGFIREGLHQIYYRSGDHTPPEVFAALVAAGFPPRARDARDLGAIITDFNPLLTLEQAIDKYKVAIDLHIAQRQIASSKRLADLYVATLDFQQCASALEDWAHTHQPSPGLNRVCQDNTGGAAMPAFYGNLQFNVDLQSALLERMLTLQLGRPFTDPTDRVHGVLVPDLSVPLGVPRTLADLTVLRRAITEVGVKRREAVINAELAKVPTLRSLCPTGEFGPNHLKAFQRYADALRSARSSCQRLVGNDSASNDMIDRALAKLAREQFSAAFYISAPPGYQINSANPKLKRALLSAGVPDVIITPNDLAFISDVNPLGSLESLRKNLIEPLQIAMANVIVKDAIEALNTPGRRESALKDLLENGNVPKALLQACVKHSGETATRGFQAEVIRNSTLPQGLATLLLEKILEDRLDNNTKVNTLRAAVTAAKSPKEYVAALKKLYDHLEKEQRDLLTLVGSDAALRAQIGTKFSSFAQTLQRVFDPRSIEAKLISATAEVLQSFKVLEAKAPTSLPVDILNPSVGDVAAISPSKCAAALQHFFHSLQEKYNETAALIAKIDPANGPLAQRLMKILNQQFAKHVQGSAKQLKQAVASQPGATIARMLASTNIDALAHPRFINNPAPMKEITVFCASLERQAKIVAEAKRNTGRDAGAGPRAPSLLRGGGDDGL